MPDYQNYLVAFEITKENETKSVQLQQQLNMVFFSTTENMMKWIYSSLTSLLEITILTLETWMNTDHIRCVPFSLHHWQTGKSMNELFFRVNGKTFCQKATDRLISDLCSLACNSIIVAQQTANNRISSGWCSGTYMNMCIRILIVFQQMNILLYFDVLSKLFVVTFKHHFLSD